MGVMYNENLHARELFDLWHKTFPNESDPPRTGHDWKRLGFQGDDPATDIRGMGMMSVRLMCFMAERYPQLHARLVARAEMDYDKVITGLLFPSLSFPLFFSHSAQVFMCMYECVRACMCTYMYLKACAYMYVCMYLGVRIFVLACMRVRAV